MPSYIKSLKSNLGDLIIPRTTATAVTYDNSTSGLESINTQDAIDEMMGKGWISSDDSIPSDPAAINADSLGGLPAADYATNESVNNKISSLDADSVNAANKELSNLSDYQKALHNIGGRPNRNLFRGWYFVGGGSQLGYGIFPINQRGNTQYTGAIYGIDGWKGVYGSEKVTIKSDCVSFEFSGNQGVKQELDKDIVNAISGNICTVSIIWRLVSGNYANFGIFVNGEPKLVPPISVSENFVLTTVTFDLSGVSASSGYGAILGDGVIEVIACKLEISSIQTLGWKDSAGKVHLLDTPDYSAELSRCQRYYCRVKGQYKTYANTTYLVINAKLPVTMRTIPAVTVRRNMDEAAGTIGNFNGRVAYTDVFAIENAKNENVVNSLQRTGGEFASTAGSTQGYEYELECSAEL